MTSDPSIQIQPITAFEDNYLWLIHNSQNAIIVDPGAAAPVQAYLNQHGLKLCAILITHHHADHIGGVSELLKAAPQGIPVYGPETDRYRISTVSHGCNDNDTVAIPELGLQFSVMSVPGHTSGHIAYYCSALSSLFCGDTLFAGGCGRLFEGTPAQMLTSLKKIAALPAQTRIYCAHEYTLFNLHFAVAAEPHNEALQKRFQEVGATRAQGLATVPSLLATELATNPFLRSDSPDIIQSLHDNHKIKPGGPTDDLSVFTAVRLWKNAF